MKMKKNFTYNSETIRALSNFLKKESYLANLLNFNLNFLYNLRSFIKVHKPSIRDSNLSIDELQELPPGQLPFSTKITAIIAELSIPQCEQYRVLHKKRILEALGYTVLVSSWTDFETSLRNIQVADFAIFYRTPFSKHVDTLYKECRRLSIPIAYDIDDLVFDVDNYRQYLLEKGLPQKEKDFLIQGAESYRECLKHSDLFITSTKELEKIASSKFPHIKSFLLPNGILEGIENVSNCCVVADNQKIKLFYGSGTNTHDEDFKLLASPLLNILNQNKEVELYILGDLRLPKEFSLLGEQVKRISKISSDLYFKYISSFDIALIPLVDSVFNRCKSNIKFIEASLNSIPSVCSDLPEFSNLIDNGYSGFIASSSKDWEINLKKLISSKSLRTEIGRKANSLVRTVYSFEQQKGEFSAILNSVKIAKHLDKKIVLFTNIFYGASSFGGATKVVESISEEFLTSTEFQPVVFTTHREVTPYTLRRYKFKGVDVFSLSMPEDPLSLGNDKLESVFELVLKAVKPVLIHHHAVQGMALSLHKAAVKCKIKEIATLHDSWFCCPNLFKISPKMKACNFFSFDPTECSNYCGYSQSFTINRYFKLADFFNTCELLLAPSNFFKTQIEAFYPKAKVIVNENGIRIPEKIENRQLEQISGPLRIGYFGGFEQVKGFHVLEESLKILTNHNWLLYTTARDKNFPTVLNPRKVIKLDYLDPKELDSLLDAIDVLVFPSIKMESFGLLPREALTHGVFVITSDCGGIEDVFKNPKLGTIVPKGNVQALTKALEDCLKNVTKIRAERNKKTFAFKSYKTQAKELEKIYKEVLEGKFWL